MNRKDKFIIDFLRIVTLSMAIFVIPVSFLKELEGYKVILLISIIIIFLLIECMILLWIKYPKQKISLEVEKLNKLISYNQKRKEIQQEIDRLTKELMESDVMQYVDVNRLVFDGQGGENNDNLIDYNNFFAQFGIQKDNIKTRKGSAIFLTPFDYEGDKLFVECQKILSNMDIFLQRTDNLVEKDDILMNIVTMIIQSELVIVNINGRNPNVYYELGIAHAIGKQTILISKANYSMEDIGFDIRQRKIIMYKNLEDLEKQLLYQINKLKK